MVSSHLYKKIVAAKIFIDQNYHRTVHLADIARFACLSDFYLLHIFKKVYHITPHQYLISVRINKAKELLVDHALSVSEICLQVGYESAASFCNTFKKYTAHSPEKYREIYRDKKISATLNPLQFIPYCFAERYAF